MQVIKLSETKGFFCFSFNKRTEFSCISYFWRMKRKSTKKITERCFSSQNKSVCLKLAWSCKKWKSTKNRYTPFLHEGLQLILIIVSSLIVKCRFLLRDKMMMITNFGIKNVWRTCFAQNHLKHSSWDFKTVGNSAKEAIKEHIIDVRIMWVSKYRCPVTKSSNWMSVVGHTCDLVPIWQDYMSNRHVENQSRSRILL